MGMFKNKMNLAILIFFIISLVFVIFSFFINDEKNVQGDIDIISTEEIAIYSTNEYLVLDHNAFYTVEDIIKKIISALSEEKYTEVFSVFSSDLAGDISKEQASTILQEYYINNFSDVKDESGNIVSNYDTNRILKNLYAYKSNSYIAEFENNTGKICKIGITLKQDYTYEIIYIEF